MISDETWDRLAFWESSARLLYEQEDLEEDDLCETCEGYGHVWPKGAGHPWCGDTCSECQGTGIKPGEKKDKLLLRREIAEIVQQNIGVTNFRNVEVEELRKLRKSLEFFRKEKGEE